MMNRVAVWYRVAVLIEKLPVAIVTLTVVIRFFY